MLSDRLDIGQLDALRLAILDGRSVIVVTEGALEPSARDAATVSGRGAELLVVHVVPSAFEVTPRPDSRILEGAAPGEVTDALADIPGVRIDALSRFDGILVVQGDGGDVLRAAADRILGAVASRRTADGLPLPLVFTKRGAVVGEPWTLRDGLPESNPPLSAWADLAGEGLPEEGAAEARWATAAAACRGRVETGEREGVAYVRDGGRTVIARQGIRDGKASFVQVVEFLPDGWCQGVLATSAFGRDMGLDRIAWLAWRGGVGILCRPGIIPGSRTAPIETRDCARSLAGRSTDGCAYPESADLVPVGCDLGLLAALPDRREAHAIVRGIDATLGDRRARRDFALTWPAFANLLLDPGVAAAVDAGVRTLPLVADRVGVSRAVARRLVGRTAMPGGAAPSKASVGRPTMDLAGLLGAIGHDALPEAGDGRGWDAFLGCVAFLHGILTRGEVDGAPARLCADLLLRSGRDWPSRLGAIERVARGSDNAGSGDVVAAFADWLGAFGNGEVDRARALALLAGDGSIVRLHEASLRWHRDRRLMDGLGGIPDSVTWPVPFRRVDLEDGWSVTVLENPRELRDEGGDGPDAEGIEGLQHCVGGYSRECWSGRSLILSVRRRRGSRTERVATAELRPRADGFWVFGELRYELMQHFGLRNDWASMGSVGALAKLQEHLQRRRVPLNLSALAPRGDEPEVGSRRDRALALLDAWRGVMPRGLRAVDPDAIAGGARAALALAA